MVKRGVEQPGGGEGKKRGQDRGRRGRVLHSACHLTVVALAHGPGQNASKPL